MKIIWTAAILILILAACKQKDDGEKKNFISVVSLVKQQVTQVDSSLFSIMKITVYDSLNSDTIYIRREQFAEAAHEFLEIPDLSNKKVAKNFREEEPLYDETTNRVIISYVPIDPAREEYKKQELTVSPNMATGDKVNTIIISRIISNRDSFMEKKMLWQMDRSFQTVTISQKPGGETRVVTEKVIWNDDNN